MREQVAYARSLVSFLDLLGFSDFVALPNNSAAAVWDTLDVVRRFAEYKSAEAHPMDAKCIVFSDSIIRARSLAPFDDPLDAFFVELNDLVLIQEELLFKGLVIRGGMTIGDVYVEPTEGLVFGPAYVRAYEIESQSATYPRIVVDDDVVSQLNAAAEKTDHPQGDAQRVKRYVRRDEARCWFIDYLRHIQTDEPEDEPRFYEAHRDLIEKRLAEHTKRPSVWRKYAWLAEYHNGFVREFIRDKAVAARLLVPD